MIKFLLKVFPPNITTFLAVAFVVYNTWIK